MRWHDELGMATLTASRKNPSMKKMFDRPGEGGKIYKVSTTAAVRKFSVFASVLVVCPERYAVRFVSSREIWFWSFVNATGAIGKFGRIP